MSTMPEQDTCQHFDIQATHEGVICVECGMLFDNVQRALDAERERDEANKELLLLHAQYRQVSNLEALRVREIAALRAERDALRADLKALVKAINWACGAGGSDFGDRHAGATAPPRFWWRSELVERAGLTYDRDSGVYILARVATEGTS